MMWLQTKSFMFLFPVFSIQVYSLVVTNLLLPRDRPTSHPGGSGNLRLLSLHVGYPVID